MSSRRRLIAGAVGAAAIAGSLVGPGSVHAGGARTLLEDLNSPKGIALALDGSIILGQGAFGPPDPVLRYNPWSKTTTEITDPVNVVDVAISPRDGTGWALGGDQVLYHRLRDGTNKPVLNIADYQMKDPDPVDIDQDPPDPFESNPYGLAVTLSGDALVADAAGNDLIRVTPGGKPTTMARWDNEVISTADVPGGFPAPAIPSEAVPTSVAIGPDGAYYVGELQGFPFKTGSSQVWRIEPWAKGVTCSVTKPQRGCSVYQGGFTAIQDIAFDWLGRMYVYELAVGGVFAFENPDPAAPPAPARLLQVRRPGTSRAQITELAAGQLFEPGGIAVTPLGQVYATDGMFSGGRLLKVS